MCFFSVFKNVICQWTTVLQALYRMVVSRYCIARYLKSCLHWGPAYLWRLLMGLNSSSSIRYLHCVILCVWQRAPVPAPLQTLVICGGQVLSAENNWTIPFVAVVSCGELLFTIISVLSKNKYISRWSENTRCAAKCVFRWREKSL